MKFIVFCISFFYSISAYSLPAFPGAEGFGTDTIGGRGGQVIAVTNLNDSGAGSFRAAVTTAGPRIVVFRVAGNILLQSRIDIDEPFLTIAGNTAPGDGVTIGIDTAVMQNGPLRIRTNDVVIRYLRIRSGPTAAGSGQNDALTITTPSYNVVVDHCSLSWATDEVLQVSDIPNITLSWNMIYEGLANSTHPEGEHSKGMQLWGGSNISVHHNLLAHNNQRNININATGLIDFTNNILYNAGEQWTNVKNEYTSAPINIVKNYYIKGPNSHYDNSPTRNPANPWTIWGYEVFVYESGQGFNPPRIYVEGNIGHNRKLDYLPQAYIVEQSGRGAVVATKFTTPEITIKSVDEILSEVGASLPVRDWHDSRIITHVKSRVGKIIDSPSEVGGYLTKAAGTAYTDTDGDGMPDDWETARCLDPDDPLDGPLDRNGDGYTNVEEFIHGMDQPLNCS